MRRIGATAKSDIIWNHTARRRSVRQTTVRLPLTLSLNGKLTKTAVRAEKRQCFVDLNDPNCKQIVKDDADRPSYLAAGTAMVDEANDVCFSHIAAQSSHDNSSSSGSPGRSFPARQRPANPEQVLKSFNTRAFKREQPDKPELMLSFVSEALAKREPVSFVLYWGKGLRPVLAAPEFACLDYLNSMMARVANCYDHGAHVDVVFTDTHAALNGHSEVSIHTYFEDLELAASRRGFATRRLSTLMQTPGLRPESEIEPQIPPDDVLAGLSASAAKWFKGDGTARDGAIRYFQANMVERRVMERAFPRSIFVTFNGSGLKSLFPDSLPIFYMFSLRHGVSDKPWFLPPDYDGRKPPTHVELAKSA